ncbi:MAG TPA: hypothetical protein DCW29_22380 [Janthinobacterium sp.]|nr:hypothetical protein [Janthinobacterium sp.]
MALDRKPHGGKLKAQVRQRKPAIAASLATILFTSPSPVRAHHRRGAVNWRIVGLPAPGFALGSRLGPWLGKQPRWFTLALAFGLFVAFSTT